MQIAAMSAADRYEHLCEMASRNRVDDVKLLLGYEIEANNNQKTELLCREFLNKRPEIFELLVRDPRFLDTDAVLEFVIEQSNDPDIVALMFEQGFRLVGDEESGLFWGMGQNKKLEFIKLLEQYQPEEFKKNIRHLNIGAVQHTSSENLRYLVTHYLELMDYPVIMRLAIHKRKAEHFNLLFSKRAEANELDLKSWDDMVDTREEALEIRALMLSQHVGYGGGSEHEDMFTVKGILYCTIHNKAFHFACETLKAEPITPDQASFYLEQCIRKADSGNDFYHLVELLLERGADPNFNSGAAVINGARGSARLLKLFQDYGVNLDSYADQLYNEALNIGTPSIVEFLNEQNVADAVEKPEALLQRALDSTFIGSEHAVDVFNALMSVAPFQNDKIIYRFLIDNAGVKAPLEVTEAMANNIQQPFLDDDFIEGLLEYPLGTNGWTVLCNFMSRGLDFAEQGDLAGKLLARAIRADAGPAIDRLLEQPELNIHVEGESPLIMALWYPEDNLVERLIEERGARVSDINWHEWYKQLEDADCKPENEAQARARLQSYLERERAEAKSFIENPETLIAQPKEIWQTPIEALGMSPLQALACREDFISLLKQAHDKTGLRFSARELLARDETGKSAFDRVVGYGYHKEFFDPFYWANHTDEMTALYIALPRPLQKEVGVNVLEQARVNNGYQNRRPRLRSRRNLS